MVRIILGILIAFFVSLGVWYFGEQWYYRFKYADQKILEADETEEGSAELLASERACNRIMFGVLGAAVGAFCGLWCHGNATVGGRVRGLIAGALLAGAGGVAGSAGGHWYDLKFPFPPDPMIYWFGRWMLILGPIAVGCGVGAALAGKDLVSKLADGVFGALIGCAAAVGLYCFLCGLVTPLEGHQYIYPAVSANRLMVMGLFACLTCGVITLRLGGKQAEDGTEAAAEDTPES